MRWPSPPQFVNGAPRQDKRSAGPRREAKALSCSENFVPDGAAQYHVQKVLQVLMVGNDTRRNAVVLEGETSPLDGRTGLGRSCFGERLDPHAPHRLVVGVSRP